MIHPELPAKALSIRQPWAWAIVHLGREIQNAEKDIENRRWATTYRGDICIHAAEGMTRAERDEALEFIAVAARLYTDRERQHVRELFRWHIEKGHRGGIIGVAKIVDCTRRHASRWFVGPYGFVLADARPVPFVPVKGALKIFDWRSRIGAAAA